MKVVRPYLLSITLSMTILFASGSSCLAVPELKLPLFLALDKAAHFLIFGLLATIVIRTPIFNKLRLSDLFFVFVIISVFGCLDELIQSLTPGRYVEYADWISDVAGAATAIFFYVFWVQYRKVLELRLRVVPKNSKKLLVYSPMLKKIRCNN